MSTKAPTHLPTRNQKCASFKDWLTHGSEALSVPGYDLFTLLFGVMTMGLFFRLHWGSDTFSLMEIVGLPVSTGLTGFFSFKAHKATQYPGMR